ncbi:MAG: S46 family peptidase [Bacteroidales bacterium]|nr:S46 family peptidase [Bacteroidales bacterium]
MKKLLLTIAVAMMAAPAFADEGMWLLPLLEKMNGKSLAEAGCRLTPEQIYSINNGSLKDAIVHFGGGCTGEIISNRGLIVTNHHCGYSSIQKLSTPEHNYLMDGYWAMTDKDELPVQGLTVTFLKKMTDVTDAIADARAKAGDDADKVEEEFIASLEKTAGEANPGCEAEVVSFYNGNVYYLIVNKVYKDIRFVGAPPASVGKYGGETDNWMWPRHTGDFSMFRVYAGPDNEPAEYSDENKPYIPEKNLKVSLEGVQEGDYAMVMGYPGRTQRFQTAAQLRNMIKTNRIRIDARTVRQDIMWEAMCADPDVQLKYANKYASSANGWKKWQGEELAFSNLGIIEREEQKEKEFMEWVGKDAKRREAYGGALDAIEKGVEALSGPSAAFTLLMEGPYRIELVTLAAVYDRALNRAPKGTDSLEFALKALEPYYKDYVVALDRKEAPALMGFYRERAAKSEYLDSLGVGFEDFSKIDFEAYADYLFEGSVFTSLEKLRAAAGKDLSDDPASVLTKRIMEVLMPLYKTAYGDQPALEAGTKAFGAGLMEWQKGKPSYPDANSTMRLTYGHVLPYSPKDGVLFRHFTTLAGVMEKEDPTNPEFIVPAGLKALYEKGDYGRYADRDGTLHTCFLTNNDITGGNSGSPVLDADGALIGLAFDGNWESMSSDVMFEPDLQRCICVDIRYVLFLVEKLGGCPRIIDELDFKTAGKAVKAAKSGKAPKKSKKK